MRRTLQYAALIGCSALLVACTGDESLTKYGAAGTIWELYEIDGRTYEADTITIRFGEKGTVEGVLPCNSYAARQTVPYPWFKLEDLRMTERACPQLFAEEAYFKELRKMTLAEVTAPYLVLSNEAGASLVFKAQAPGA